LDYKDFLTILPATLKNELGYLINKKKLGGIPFFDHKPKDFIASVGPIMKKLQYSKSDFIYNEGDPANDIYFIKSGKVSAVLRDCFNFKYLKWTQGQAFGHVDIITGSSYRKETIQVNSNCEVLQCSKKNFERVFC
jgi:CRP-like cAMP-binding protein